MRKLFAVPLKKLSLLEKTWLLAPLVVWFSYRPMISLGQDSTSYYELSLPLVYLLVLGLVGLPSVWRHRAELVKQKSVWLLASFVFINVSSLLWTPNVLRGVLTTGIVGLLFLVFLAASAEQKKLKKLVPLLARIFVASAVVMSILALIQVVAGVWLSRPEALLCAGCVADQFGFVRPNVFAVEPQFFGSLLLVPVLLLAREMMRGNKEKLVAVSFLAVAAGLFLTLSRGAIFAFAAGFLVLLIVSNKQLQYSVKTVFLIIVAFLTTLVLQGSTAALNPNVNVSFSGAVSASVNQLSLGLVDIPADKPEVSPKSTSEPTAPVQDGYVEESTDTRLSLSQLAVNTWAANPVRMMFGVGAGGSGAAMHAQFPEQIAAREIVQNQYVEVLLEFGLVGLALFGAMFVGFVWQTRQTRWTWSLLAAFGLQWIFFSGYPNALHIYLALIAVFVVSARRGQVAPTRLSAK